MNRTFQRGRTTGLYSGFKSKYPKCRDTEIKIYISQSISREVSRGASECLSQMINGLTYELARNKL